MIDPKNILVFLPNWVGDVVMATPALRALRARFGGARITFFGRKIALDVMTGTAWADAQMLDESNKSPRLLHFARTSMHIREGRFDLAVLLPNSFRTAALARMGGGIGEVAGYDRDGRGWLLSHKIQAARDERGRFVPVPTIEYYNALARLLGCEEPGRRMELPVAAADDRAAAELLAVARSGEAVPGEAAGGGRQGVLVMLNPGASFGPSKLWPAERFAAVADGLIDSHGAGIIINAAPAERGIAKAVGEAMKHRPLINFAERDNSLGLLKGLLRRCELLITNDTGARHFGAALGTGIVTIFGSTDPTWAQLDYPRERILRAEVPCSPCQSKVCLEPAGETFHQCMKAITPEMVLAASRELLDLPAEARA